MSNPNRTDYEGEPLSGPGILWINSKVTDPVSLPVEAFERWYEDVHIPDIIAAKPGGIVASWRYKCHDVNRPAPFLAVYRVPDLGFLQSPEFMAISMQHPSLPSNGPIHRFAEFDARFLGHVETWSSERAEDGRTKLLVSEAIEPAEGSLDSFHDWYRHTYIKEIAALPGWRRTSRFTLVFKKENKDDVASGKVLTPKWLSLHEFEPGAIEIQDGQRLLSSSEETQAVEKSARKVDVASFEILLGFGEQSSRWVETSEKKL